MPAHLFPDVESHLIDTTLFIRFERHDTSDLLERAVTEHDIVLLVPQRVYDELTPESYPYDQPRIDDAIKSGWVQVLDDVDYSNPVVSATMDTVRQYISVATDRPEHTVEQAVESAGPYGRLLRPLSGTRQSERRLVFSTDTEIYHLPRIMTGPKH